MPKSKRAYLRPFSEISRGELQIYAEVNNLTYWEDESNKNECFDRNFIRQQLIAKMTERFPNCLEHYRSRQLLSKRNNYLTKKWKYLIFQQWLLRPFLLTTKFHHLDLDLIGSFLLKN